MSDSSINIADEDFEKLKAFLSAHEVLQACPQCGGKDFTVTPPSILVHYTRSGVGSGVVHLTDGVPVVGVVCVKCYHVALFAWRPIQEGTPL